MGLRCVAAMVLLGAACAQRFEAARVERPIRLPEDHRFHPEFKTEWWYWNGHLATPEGKRYDFFLSFTRHDPRGDFVGGLPVLTTGQQVWLGLFALTDRQTGTYHALAKVNTPDTWAAGAARDRPFFWHDSWSAQWTPDGFFLTAHVDERVLHLRLRPRKEAVLYGQQGFVDLANAPHYVYSYTDLAADGALWEGERSTPVKGLAWFDHFIGQVKSHRVRAWDWMSLQLDDGYQYMFGQLRTDAGLVLSYANFEVAPDGAVRSLPPDQPRWAVLRKWKSPRTDQVYRVGFRVEADELSLDVEARVDDQEFHRAPIRNFWEGAARVAGTHRGRAVQGEAYLETVSETGLPVTGIRFAR